MKLHCTAVLAAATLAASLSIQAAGLVNGNFDSNAAGTTFPASDFVGGSATTGWLDQSTWATVSGNGTNHPLAGEPAATASPSGGNWARQWPGTAADVGQMLRQGFSATGITAGSLITLSFEYVTDNAEAAFFRIYGMDAGENFSQFAPNNCGSCDLLIAVASSNLTADLNGQWTTFSQSFVLPRAFDSIALGVHFGSNTTRNPGYIAGIDNVSITAVPEPASLALLGLGLAGLALVRRKTK